MFANWSAWWRGATLVGRVTQLESDLSYHMEMDMLRQDDQGEMLLGLHALQRRLDDLEDHLKNWPDDEAYSGMGL